MRARKLQVMVYALAKEVSRSIQLDEVPLVNHFGIRSKGIQRPS